MTQPMARLLLASLLVLAAGSGRLEAQLPQPGTDPAPVPVRDPTVAPPLPSRNPKLGPQPAVQPGTILRDPRVMATQELKYLPAGEAPGGLQVTATAPRTVTLSWTAPAGAIGYWIHQAAAGQTTFYRGGSMVTEPTALVTGLLPATSYGFKVSAVYPQEANLGEGLSGPITATTAPAPVPAGLAAAVVGRGLVSLHWNPLLEADGFQVVRNDTTVIDIKPMHYTGGTSLATTANDSLMPGTHRYQIAAVYRAYNDPTQVVVSAPSPAVSVVIPASSRVRYCQTRAGRQRCAEAESPSVTIAALGLIGTAGRTIP